MSLGLSNLGSSTSALGVEAAFQKVLELSADPLFPDKPPGPSKKLSFLKTADSTSGSKEKDVVKEKLLRMNLDLTRVSNRLLVMGRCWAYRTDREGCRNNADEVACFLGARYDQNYLIFNFGSPDIKYDTAPFRNHVVPFPVSKMLSPTIKTLFNACRAMAAWIRLSPQNVIVVQCKNGKNRSGLAMACFLRFCGLFDTTYEAFEYFISKRSKGDASWASVTLRRYLRYFNDILILEGRLPSSIPLKLHQVILTTIPNFDGNGGCNPGIEVYQEGRLAYSSAIRYMNVDAHSRQKGADQDDMDEELLREFKISLAINPDKIDTTYNPLVMMDDFNIIFRLENISLERDVQIRVYHHNKQAGQHVTVFNLAFNTGFMAPGIIRLRKGDLETNADASRYDEEFAVDLIVTADEKNTDPISYESATHRTKALDLMKLSQCHAVRADPQLAKPLELQGHRKFFVKLALQLGNNDIHAAHEFLSYLSKSPDYLELDRELNELARAKYDKVPVPKPVQVRILEEPTVGPQKAAVEQPSAKEQPDARPFNHLLAAIRDSRGGAEELVGEQSATTFDNPPLAPARVNPLLEAIRRAKGDPLKTQSASGGPPFLASLKAASSSLHSQAEDDSERSAIQGQNESDKTPAKVALAQMATTTPLAPPIPDYLRGTVHPPPPAGIPEAPPFPEFLRPHTSPFGSRASLIESRNFELSEASLSRCTSSTDLQYPVGPSPPPPPFPGSLRGHPLPPAPPVPSAAGPPAVEISQHRIKNALHWGEIRNAGSNTVWSEILEQSTEEEQAFDVHRFEELFCVNPADELAARKSKQSSSVSEDHAKYSGFREGFFIFARNAPRILDSRRANNIGIGLSRFYKRMTNAEIINAVLREKRLLNIDDLLCLKTIIPTDDERQAMQLFTGNPEMLIVSERFMYDVCRIPCLDWMVDALILEMQFPAECESITARLTLVSAMLIKIRESPSLKALFTCVLELGNLANYNYGRVPAHMRIRGKALGFTMDSLLKLQEVKSVDRKSSLMNYLLTMVSERSPEILALPADFAELATIKHWDIGAIHGEIDTLKASLNRVVNLSIGGHVPDQGLVESFRESQASFVALAKIKLENLSKLADHARSSWTETAGYLGEDPDDKKPEELFIVFDQFFRQFKEAHRQNEEVARQMSRIASGNASRAGTSAELRIRSPQSSRSASPISEIATETTVDAEL